MYVAYQFRVANANLIIPHTEVGGCSGGEELAVAHTCSGVNSRCGDGAGAAAPGRRCLGVDDDADEGCRAGPDDCFIIATFCLSK